MMQCWESKNIKSNIELYVQRIATRNEKLWKKKKKKDSLKPHLSSQGMVRGLRRSKINSKKL